MKTKRLKYYVRWDKSYKMWGVFVAAAITKYFTSKRDAIEDARIRAKFAWSIRLPAQVIVFKKNGRIQTEYTYGKDPKRYKG